MRHRRAKYLLPLFAGVASISAAEVHALPPQSPPEILPAWETAAERAARPPTLQRDAAFRDANPALFAITAPPQTDVALYAEWGPISDIYYVWFPGTFDQFYADLTDALVAHGGVQVNMLVMSNAHRTQVESLINGGGGNPAAVSFTDLSGFPSYGGYPLDSVWAVDYGPFWVLDGAGTLAIVDPRYVYSRPNDDALPGKLASLLGVSVFRPDIDWDGGNLLSDGAGTCITTSGHLAENLPILPSEVESVLRDYYGCEQAIFLRPLAGEPTGHVDMFLRWVDPTTIIMGEYTAGDDDENKAILDANVARLAAARNLAGNPFEIHRIPMPSNDNRRVWRTYTNSIQVNDLLVFPTYAQATTHEAAAANVYAQLLPGFAITAVDSDEIIQYGGAVHCVTRTRPVGALQSLEATPVQSCGGDWDCGAGGCGEVDPIGLCLDEFLGYCQGSAVLIDECGGTTACGWDPVSARLDCVPAGCDGVGAEGRCTQSAGSEFALRCDGSGYLRAARCAPGETCGERTDGGGATCRACADECTPGERWCEQGIPWRCGEADDGDPCYEPVADSCPGAQTCQAGACLPADPGANRGGCAAAGGDRPLPDPILIILLGLCWLAARRRCLSRAR